MNRVFKVGTLVSMLMLAGLISGCAAFPEDYQKRIDAPVDARAEVNWANGPAITYVDASSSMAVKKFSELPAKLAAVPVEFKFAADVTLSDVAAALRTQNIKVVNALNVKTQLVEMRVFKGTVGEFLSELAMANNIGYEYMNGVVFLKDVSRFTVTLPQNETLFAKVTEVITAFGAVNVVPDIQAGQIFYSAKPDSSSQISEYLQVVAHNSAMVTLQVAVLDVRLSRDRNIGIDWSQLGAQIGTQDWTPLTTTGLAAAAAPILGQSLGITGTGISFKLATSNFSLSAVLRALSTMGEAKTEQNVTMGTLSGIPVKISSGNSIPYVKSIGATTTAAVGAAAVQGTAVTDIVKSGLRLEVKPNFNASDMSITTELTAEMSSLVGFRELSAGVNLGTLSQPEIQEMTFKNMGRLVPGETLVVGGITYDQISKNYTSFPGLEKEVAGSKAEKVQKHAIYIVVRPSVTLFGKPPAAAAAVKQPEAVVTPVASATPVVMQKIEPQAVPVDTTSKLTKSDLFMRVIPLKSGETVVVKARSAQQYKVVRDTMTNAVAAGVSVTRVGEDMRLSYDEGTVTLEGFYSVCKTVEQCSVQLPGNGGKEVTLSGDTVQPQLATNIYTQGVRRPGMKPALGLNRVANAQKVAK